MPIIDLSEEERAAVIVAVRRSITEDKFPRSPRLAPAEVRIGEA